MEHLWVSRVYHGGFKCIVSCRYHLSETVLVFMCMHDLLLEILPDFTMICSSRSFRILCVFSWPLLHSLVGLTHLFYCLGLSVFYMLLYYISCEFLVVLVALNIDMLLVLRVFLYIDMLCYLGRFTSFIISLLHISDHSLSLSERPCSDKTNGYIVGTSTLVLYLWLQLLGHCVCCLVLPFTCHLTVLPPFQGSWFDFYV